MLFHYFSQHIEALTIRGWSLMFLQKNPWLTLVKTDERRYFLAPSPTVRSTLPAHLLCLNSLTVTMFPSLEISLFSLWLLLAKKAKPRYLCPVCGLCGGLISTLVAAEWERGQLRTYLRRSALRRSHKLGGPGGRSHHELHRHDVLSEPAARCCCGSGAQTMQWVEDRHTCSPSLSFTACFFFCSFSTSAERRDHCGQCSFVLYTPGCNGPGPQQLSPPSPFPQMAANLTSTGTISYDAFGQRIRVRKFGAVGNETFTIDQLMLFRQVHETHQLWAF